MKPKSVHLLVLVALVISSLAASNFQGNNATPPPTITAGQSVPWAMKGAKNISNETLQTRPISGETMTPAMLTKFLPALSGRTTELLAQKLGITAIEGKKLDIGKLTDMDNIVNADKYTYENEPSIAVNPANDAIVVAFHHFYPTSNSCIAQVSFDGGDTFDYNNYIFLPLQAGGNSCSDPIVRFSPDGSRVYFFYMDIDSGGVVSDVVMSTYYGYDPTVYIAGPKVIFNDYGDFVDKPWGDVAYYDYSGASDPVIYSTTTLFGAAGYCGILFNASYDYGATWWYGDGGLLLALDSDCNPLVQGSRAIGNPYSGWVTACWYDSEVDGIRNGVFDVDCWSHNNWGAISLGGTQYFFPAVNDQKYELAYYLGPNGAFHRWWGGMFPSLGMDATGLLYIAFTSDPTASFADAQAGDVWLARGWPTGALWTKSAVGTGSTAQGYATVTARCDNKAGKCYGYVAYEDHLTNNLLYNIVYRKSTRAWSVSTPGTFAWSGKMKVSDVPSFSDYSFIGDYIDSFATARRYEVIWTDRSDALDIFDYDDDVMHDVLLP